jgi:predicted ATPase/transcriptional regulator with XRE-family HTH domain
VKVVQKTGQKSATIKPLTPIIQPAQRGYAMDIGASFGAWLKRRRKALDLTQDALAAQVGCSVATIQKIESDERRPSRQIADLLAQQLAIPPDERATFMKVARGELRVTRLAEAAPTVVATSPVSEPPPVGNLPIPPTPLIGRTAELTALSQLLCDPHCRLITLIGAGGMGKTRLAIEAAAQHAADFSGGAYFVPLASLSSSAFLALAIADALGLKFQGQIEPGAQLFNYLLGRSALLVLDNFEHLLGGADLLADIMQCAPQVKLLVTSRERLNLPGEWVFEIHGLPVPGTEHDDRLTENSAVQLFAQCAARARHDFALGPVEVEAAVRVCQAVEGLPLGIELAASWVRVLSCQEIAREIESNLDFLVTPTRHVPQRHRSLRAVFEHSWNLLPPAERELLRQLAIFSGGFRREAAEYVAGATLPGLLALVDKSLVRRTNTGRYDLHEVVRQYALAHLIDDPACEAAARERHSEFYLSLVKAHEKAARSAAQAETIRELTDEIDNIRTAWAWAVKRDRIDVFGPAVRVLGMLYELLGWLREGIEQLELVIRALQSRSPSKEQVGVTGQAMAMQALLYFRWGQFDRAQTLLDESLALLRPIGDPALLVDSLVLNGVISHLMGQIDRAQTLTQEGLHCARAAGDAWFTAYALFNLGYVAGLLGRYEEGYQQMLDGLALWRKVGDPRYIALGLNFISPLAVTLGRSAEARAYLQESLQLCAQVNDRWGLGTAYRHLGVVALAQGQVAEAKSCINQSLEIYTGYVTGWDIAQSLVYLGEATAAEDATREAECIFRKALDLALESHSIPLVLEALVGVAYLKAQTDQIDLVLDIIGSVVAHPASTQAIRDRVQSLRAELKARLAPDLVASTQAKARNKPLEEIIAAIMTADDR